MNPMMMMGQPAAPRATSASLWNAAGRRLRGATSVDLGRTTIPYPKLSQLSAPEFVFVDDGCGAKEPFNAQDPISSGLQQLAVPLPRLGARKLNASSLKFTPLVQTGEKTGTVRFREHDRDDALRPAAG